MSTEPQASQSVGAQEITATSQRHALTTFLVSPFCPQRCAYCAYHPLDALRTDWRRDYADALEAEVRSSASGFSDCQLKAVRIGGGIAGHLFDEQLGELLHDMRDLYHMEDAEVSLKVHPGMVSATTLEACDRGHINRLSIEYVTGIEGEHRRLGRFLDTHAMDITRMLLESGKKRLLLDFDVLYGVPGQTDNSLIRSLDKALEYGADHISLYPLEVLPGTELEATYRDDGKEDAGSASAPLKPLPTKGQLLEMEASARKHLENHGLHEYLSGRFAKPDAESRWFVLQAEHTDCLGFGLGAESTFMGTVSRNTDDLNTYLEASDDFARITVDVHAATESGHPNAH